MFSSILTPSIIELGPALQIMYQSPTLRQSLFIIIFDCQLFGLILCWMCFLTQNWNATPAIIKYLVLEVDGTLYHWNWCCHWWRCWWWRWWMMRLRVGSGLWGRRGSEVGDRLAAIVSSTIHNWHKTFVPGKYQNLLSWFTWNRTWFPKNLGPNCEIDKNYSLIIPPFFMDFRVPLQFECSSNFSSAMMWHLPRVPVQRCLRSSPCLPCLLACLPKTRVGSGLGWEAPWADMWYTIQLCIYLCLYPTICLFVCLSVCVLRLAGAG